MCCGGVASATDGGPAELRWLPTLSLRPGYGAASRRHM